MRQGALIALCALACAHAVPLRGVANLKPAGPAEAEVLGFVEVKERLNAGVPVPEVQATVMSMHAMLQDTLAKIEKKHEERKAECSAKVEALDEARDAAKKDLDAAVSKRVEAEAARDDKHAAVEAEKKEIRSLNAKLEEKKQEIEDGNVKRAEEKDKFDRHHSAHIDTLDKARSIAAAIESEGMAAAPKAAALIELAAERHGFRAEQQAALHGSTEEDAQRIRFMLDRLVSSVADSLDSVRTRETRAQEAWEKVKAELKKQVEALSTRKAAVLQSAVRLHNELTELTTAFENAKQRQHAAQAFLEAQQRKIAAEQDDCKQSIEALADEVARRQEDLATAESLHDMLASHHADLLATGATGETGATGVAAAGHAFGH